MWKVSDSVDMYGVDRWGEDYFDIDGEGNVTVAPDPEGPSVPIVKIIGELRAQGFKTPITLRFPQILTHRIQALHRAFERAVEEFGYDGAHRAVFPFKVKLREFFPPFGNTIHISQVFARYANHNSICIYTDQSQVRYLHQIFSQHTQ